MTRIGTYSHASLHDAVAAVATARAAQQPSPKRAIQELIRAAAAWRRRPGSRRTGHRRHRRRRRRASGRCPLSLDDAVKLALDRNLDIAVQRLNPQINDIAIASLESVYHPTLTSQLVIGADDEPVDQHALRHAPPGSR